MFAYGVLAALCLLGIAGGKLRMAALSINNIKPVDGKHNNVQERNVALDFYRILCMFLITTIHIINYSDLIDHIPQAHINFYVINLLKTLQVFSISGFTMISAYFLIGRTSTKKKTISFILQLAFFSIIIFLLSLVFISTDVSKTTFLKSLFPITFYHFWYPVNYVVLLLLIPFLNKAFKAFTRKEVLTGIIVLASVVSLFFHMNPFFDPTVFVGHHTHSLIHFILLYLIAAYIKTYGVKRPKLFGLGMFLVTGALLFVVYTIYNGGFGGFIETYPINKTGLERVNLLSYNSILSLLFTVSSFILVTHMKVPVRKSAPKVMAFLIPATFVIYLIQEHSAVRHHLWKFVGITKWADSYMLIPAMILTFVGLWCIATLLYLLYWVFHKLFICRLEVFLCNLIDRLRHRLGWSMQ